MCCDVHDWSIGNDWRTHCHLFDQSILWNSRNTESLHCLMAAYILLVISVLSSCVWAAETSSDLAIAVAVASSYIDHTIPSDMVCTLHLRNSSKVLFRILFITLNTPLEIVLPSVLFDRNGWHGNGGVMIMHCYFLDAVKFWISAKGCEWWCLSSSVWIAQVLEVQ